MRTLGLITVVAALATGCSGFSPTAEEHFGDAVRSSRAAQTANPQAPQRRAAPSGLDGQAAKAAVDNYQKSFTSPTQQNNVLNIGLGGNDSGSNSK